VLGDRDSPVRAPDTSEDSLHLHLSLSEEDQSTNDSFVTCAGEVNDSFVMCAGEVNDSFVMCAGGVNFKRCKLISD